MNVLLRTFGCQMNEYDSELVRSILIEEGYSFTDQERERSFWQTRLWGWIFWQVLTVIGGCRKCWNV